MSGLNSSTTFRITDHDIETIGDNQPFIIVHVHISLSTCVLLTEQLTAANRHFFPIERVKKLRKNVPSTTSTLIVRWVQGRPITFICYAVTLLFSVSLRVIMLKPKKQQTSIKTKQIAQP